MELATFGVVDKTQKNNVPSHSFKILFESNETLRYPYFINQSFKTTAPTGNC